MRVCVCAGGCQCGCFGVDEYLRGVCVLCACLCTQVIVSLNEYDLYGSV